MSGNSTYIDKGLNLRSALPFVREATAHYRAKQTAAYAQHTDKRDSRINLPRGHFGAELFGDEILIQFNVETSNPHYASTLDRLLNVSPDPQYDGNSITVIHQERGTHLLYNAHMHNQFTVAVPKRILEQLENLEERITQAGAIQFNETPVVYAIMNFKASSKHARCLDSFGKFMELYAANNDLEMNALPQPIHQGIQLNGYVAGNPHLVYNALPDIKRFLHSTDPERKVILDKADIAGLGVAPHVQAIRVA